MTVYLIGEVGTRNVKIGTTGNSTVDSRLRSLQTGNPRHLRVLLQFPGDRRCEKKLHILFSAKHLYGEWFELTKEDLERAKDPERYDRAKKTNEWLENELSKPYLEGYLDLT